MQNIKTRILSNISFAVLICLLIIYVLVRAVCIDMTHDEAYSFYNVKHFWYVETLCTGNTHWFNFVAIKAAILVGCEKTWQLRWFSILSAIVFLSVGYYWIKTLKFVSTKVFAFSFLFLNPYLLDYLSLVRGYAAGLMFEALSILCLMIAYDTKKRSVSFFSLFFAGMAAIANFNFFYFFSAFTLIYFFNYHFKNELRFFRDKRFYVDIVFAIAIAALVLRALLFITKCSNDIGEYGGEAIVESMFYGFIEGFIYRNVALQASILSTFSYILFAIVLCGALFGLLNIKKKHQQLYTYSSCIYLVMIILMLINRYFFNVLYPTYRTTLMFFPLIAIILTYFFSEILRSLFLKKILLFSLSVLFVANFLTSLNLYSTFDYPEQRDAKTAFKYLQDLNADKVGIAPEVYGVFRNYYQQTDKYKYQFIGESINTSVPVGIDTQNNKLSEFEYLILFPPYNMSFYKKNSVQFKGMRYFSNTDLLIVKIIKR